MKQFIITTTNNIEGAKIQRYIDTVCVNVVTGTNVFSDIAASFTDFFGGRSESYKKRTEQIYNEAISELKEKASEKGANAIIGFKVDFDEISGKDKSMFMISVSGTACLVDYEETRDIGNSVKCDFVTNERLKREINRKYIVEQINNDAPIKEEWMEFLLEHPQLDVLDNLINRYIAMTGVSAYVNECAFVIRLFTLMPKEAVLDRIYSKVIDSYNEICQLISKANLFDAERTLKVLEKDIHIAISLISSDAEMYSSNDLELMKSIYDKLTNLPETGKVEIVKGGLFGKEEQKFICECGHKNDLDRDFCASCGVNKYGLKRDQVDVITAFKNRIDALEFIFRSVPES